MAQQTIATQAVIKEMGFGSHFRSYVLKAVRREMAIASHSLDWGAPVQLVRQTLGHTSLHKLYAMATPSKLLYLVLGERGDRLRLTL
ncbi:hypothetical protein [Nostoc sp.]|uniref:hypothetical protein n=1 Tax=Nostoc sp. TaxID=1180 RepID=UPI002FF91978